jgi:uncharacterized protein YkwD
MDKRVSIGILFIVGLMLAFGFWGCGGSEPPVPRAEMYGGIEPEYDLTEDEAELFDILNLAYRRRTGRSLRIDGWLQGAARRMNWVLRKRGYGISGKDLWRQVIHGDSVAAGITSPEAMPLAALAQQNIWIVGSTLAYPFVFTGLSAGFFDEFDADRLSWDDIEGFGCNVVGIGVSRQSIPPGRWVTFLFAERGMLLDEFPKRVYPDEAYYFSGIMQPGYRDPGLLVTTPGGDVLEFEVEENYSGQFGVEVYFEDAPGKYLLEVTCTSPSGPRVGALFPVSADQGYPEFYPLWREAGYLVHEEPESAEEEMVYLINRDRARFRLPAVRQNVLLSRIARQYSGEMRDGKFLAHVSPEGRDLKSRLADMGVLYQEALENVSVGYSIAGVEAGLMNSPGHRRNILDPDVNQVGVGIVWTEGEDPARAYVTQLFVETFEKLDPMTGRDQVLAELNRRRLEQGLGPLQRNYQADWLAENHCRAIANIGGGKVESQSEGDIMEKLQRSGIAYQRAAAIVKQVGNLDQILESEVLFDTTYSQIGMGLYQTEDREAMASWVWATIILFSN